MGRSQTAAQPVAAPEFQQSVSCIMKEVFVHHDPSLVGLKKSILEEAGIDCFIRNEDTSGTLGAGALGLVLSPAFEPALCIVDDERYEEAMALVGDAKVPPPLAGTDWRCPKCGEMVPGNFDTCWNCSTTRPQGA
jgi:hypothetical protein